MLLQTQENINHSTIVGYNGISHLSCNEDHFDISKYFQKSNTGKGGSIMKYPIIFLLTSSLVFNVTADSTSNRTLFGTFLVSSALAASVCMYSKMYIEFMLNLSGTC